VVGECKWTDHKIGRQLLKDLEEKTDKVRWKNANREEQFVIFSKSGFTHDLQNKAEQRDDLELYDLEKVQNQLQ